MAAARPDLIACYWTLCGPIADFFGDDTSPRDFRDRVEAASRAGFTGIGIKDNDIEKVAARYGYDGMAAILDDNGIQHLEIEALFDWFADGERRQRSDRTRRILLQAAEKLDPHHVKVVGDFTDPDAGIDPMREDFDRLCREFAAVSGLKVALEITTLSNIRDIPAGLDLVRSASSGNAGLMLDIWHVTRAGIPYDELAAIPLQYIAGVEIDDADAAVVGTLLEDTIHRRKLCGEGDFDIAGFLSAVARTGYGGPIGVEVISEQQMKLPLDEAAQRLFDTSLRAIEDARALPLRSII